MSRSDNSEITQRPTNSGTKLCHISKRAGFDGYGFNLHSEKIRPGQFIGKVDKNSPASEAGLKEGDRIIEVNGVPIGSETHKQVVLRIKTIPNEVRLLLTDVDATANSKNAEQHQGSIQEIPGESANISTISMISTKRLLNKSTSSNQTSAAIAVPVPPPTIPIDADFTDSNIKNGGKLNANELHIKHQRYQKQQVSKNLNSSLLPSTDTASSSQTEKQSTALSDSNGKETGSLQLPVTAAEMRAKLMLKKKYDPKNESVDLRKKFEIIQKL